MKVELEQPYVTGNEHDENGFRIEFIITAWQDVSKGELEVTIHSLFIHTEKKNLINYTLHRKKMKKMV